MDDSLFICSRVGQGQCFFAPEKTFTRQILRKAKAKAGKNRLSEELFHCVCGAARWRRSVFPKGKDSGDELGLSIEDFSFNFTF